MSSSIENVCKENRRWEWWGHTWLLYSYRCFIHPPFISSKYQGLVMITTGDYRYHGAKTLPSMDRGLQHTEHHLNNHQHTRSMPSTTSIMHRTAFNPIELIVIRGLQIVLDTVRHCIVNGQRMQTQKDGSQAENALRVCL